MKNYIKWMIGVAALALFICGAYFMYERLADGNGGSQLVVDTSDQENDTADKETENSEQETEDSSETDTVIDYKAQDFTVIDQNGNNVKLSDMAGKVVVANFWATWCGYCKLEMPDFEEMYKKYGDDLVFMMINSGDIVEDAKAYVKSQGFTFPVYFDVYNEASIQYSVTSFPTTFFFSKDGAKVARAIGMINSETIEQGISMVTE